MMNLRAVKKEDFSSVYKRLIAAFPYEERRDEKDEEACFLKKEFNFCEIMDETESVGIIVFWVFESFLFIEHIAINEECRSKGYGTKAIELIKKEYNLPIILEAEFPETEIQKKRIRFYENSGFKINSYSYIQPSYHEDEGVPLQILSFPEALSKEAFDLFLKETRAVVYEITDFKL